MKILRPEEVSEAQALAESIMAKINACLLLGGRSFRIERGALDDVCDAFCESGWSLHLASLDDGAWIVSVSELS